ncbi:hypothetical protein AB0M46_27935 [Dactylosporangium sp. NPDC051485]|uniref:hypothetical protein n=1 Tax=Dactylosporangium sp. NPDC051485 TaxID=3154846 RepID=UPI0034352B86
MANPSEDEEGRYLVLAGSRRATSRHVMPQVVARSHRADEHAMRTEPARGKQSMLAAG